MIDLRDADVWLQGTMAGFIEAARLRAKFGKDSRWKPGQPLRILFAGYSGTRNTGADVRVEEIVRQVRHLLGDSHIEMSILTIEPEGSATYFQGCKQLHLPKVFPKFLFDVVHDHHMVVACEGSMFKSKFASALSTMMVGALGLAAAEGKLAIAYGGEAGDMDPSLEALVKRYAKESVLVVRTAASKQKLADLGLDAVQGTDTAWTFSPRSPERGAALLKAHGWDGIMPILAVAPINPFWWPVKPNLTKGFIHALTQRYKDTHYASVYFHRGGKEVQAKQTQYLKALSESIKQFADQRGLFVISVGMEKLDRSACEAFSQDMGTRVPVFCSDTYDIHEMVSVLWQARFLVTSRYHAAVTSMSAGVLSLGVTMDERLQNLMESRGQPSLCLKVDDPDLQAKVLDRLELLDRDADFMRRDIKRSVSEHLYTMGTMGQVLVEAVRRAFPDFSLRSELGFQGDPIQHLPTLDASLQALTMRRSADSMVTPTVVAAAVG